MVRDGLIRGKMKLREAPIPRAAVLAMALSALHPMLEGCANLPPIGHPDSGVADDGGRGRDGGISMPDAGRPSCPMDSERLYVGGGPAAFHGELFVLESSAGYSAQISVSDSASGSSAFVSIPEWGSQRIMLAGKAFTIFVSETYDGSPSWADVDIYGC